VRGQELLWAAEFTAARTPFSIMSDTAQEFIAFGRIYKNKIGPLLLRHSICFSACIYKGLCVGSSKQKVFFKFHTSIN